MSLIDRILAFNERLWLRSSCAVLGHVWLPRRNGRQSCGVCRASRKAAR